MATLTNARSISLQEGEVEQLYQLGLERALDSGNPDKLPDGAVRDAVIRARNTAISFARLTAAQKKKLKQEQHFAVLFRDPVCGIVKHQAFL